MMPKARFWRAVVAVAALAALAAAGGYGASQVPPAGSTTPMKKPATAEPVMKITISGPTLASLGEPIAIEITVSNSGEGACAKGYTVTATLPDAVEYDESDPQAAMTPACGKTPATVAWTLPEIGPGDQAEMTIAVRAVKPGSWTPTASLSITAAPFPLKIIGAPGLVVSSRDAQDPIKVGQTAAQVIEVRNEGTAMCTGIALRVTIPPEMEFVNAEGPAGEIGKAEGSDVRFEEYPILPPGSTLTYKLVWRAVKEGAAKRTVVLTYAESDRPITEEKTITCVR